ncbi:hypothetical protein pEaSNUABM52_00299 [Erwinia phage pEp_SNUABM_52]|nr:hypothetical protein pEaSNUABM52_00299 [Erwinia phage pEp_SNUABM_52]
MGVVKGITSTEFPARDRDEYSQVIIQMSDGTFSATLMRRDRTEPLNTIWRIDGDCLPEEFFQGTRPLYVSASYLQDNGKSLLVAAGPNEGLFCEVCFDFDLKSKVDGVVLTHRANQTIIQILSGPHEGRIVSSAECQYSILPYKGVKL